MPGAVGLWQERPREDSRLMLEAWLKELLPYAIGAASTFILINALRPLALRIGLVDAPGLRKTHEGEVPLVGGIAMALGIMFGLLALEVPLAQFRALFAGGALLAAVGVLDDFRELSPQTRFGAQILACLLMAVNGDVVLRDFGQLFSQNSFVLVDFAVPVTVFAAMGLINAINFVDGIDGLAGIEVWIALAGAAVLCWLGGDQTYFKLSILAGAVVAAFLYFNAPGAARDGRRVFMGDAGSLLLGFVLVWILIAISQGPDQVMSPVVGLYLVAVPLFDTFTVMLRRMRSGRSPLRADSMHVHHLLVRAGLTPGATVAVLGLFSAILAGAGIAGYRLGIPDRYLFVAIWVAYGAYLVIVWRAWHSGRLFGRTLVAQEQGD